MLDFNLRGEVADFAKARGLSARKEEEQFGVLVTDLLFRKYHKVAIKSIEDHVTDGGGDGGLDSIGIFVNGTPVRAKEDLEGILPENMPRADVEFVFIQAKTTEKFKATDIGNFGYGVAQFFEGVKGNEPGLAFNDAVLARIAVAKALFAEPHRVQVRNAGGPKCALYFATGGRWSDDHDPAQRLEAARRHISEMDLGITNENVRAQAIDKKDLTTIARDLRLAIKRTVPYDEALEFPKIQNVEKAYIVLMKAKAFVDLVSTDGGDLNEDLFFENLRAFQGHNEVNSEIRNTLATDQTRDSFPLLNNGITVVARELYLANKELDVSDYQIVNGCQTTHVLFQNRQHIGDSVSVPVKFVVAQDRQVIENVITATNKQTAVTPAAFQSLKPFHQDLEEAYLRGEKKAILDRADRIYYERRSKQYVNEGIREANIVDLEAQTLSFVAMFAEAPHHHVRNCGQLLQNEYKDRLFVSQEHSVEPYYASGVALVALRRWLESHPGRAVLSEYRFHLLMLAKLSVAGPTVAKDLRYHRQGKDKIVDAAERVIEAVRDAQKGPSVWERAVAHLREALKNYPEGEKQPHEDEAFTAYLLRDRQPTDTDVDVPEIDDVAVKGTILWFDEASRYGRIKTQDGRELFVDSSEINEVPSGLRMAGTSVTLEIGPAPVKGAQMTAMKVKPDLGGART